MIHHGDLFGKNDSELLKPIEEKDKDRKVSGIEPVFRMSHMLRNTLNVSVQILKTINQEDDCT